MARRIEEVVIETDCGHGDVIGAAHDWVEKWQAWVPCSADTVGAECSAEHCPGGSRRVLDPGSYLLVEKAEDQEWRDEDADKLLQWAIPRLRRYESHSGGRYRQVEDCAEDLDFMMGALDALADGEQP